MCHAGSHGAVPSPCTGNHSASFMYFVHLRSNWETAEIAKQAVKALGSRADANLNLNEIYVCMLLCCAAGPQ